MNLAGSFVFGSIPRFSIAAFIADFESPLSKMPKCLGRLKNSELSLIIRTPSEWNVETNGVSSRDTGWFSVRSSSRSFLTRSLISLADLLVKVIASIDEGLLPCFIICNIRWVIVFVLPAPAPARIKSGPSVVKTACLCGVFKVFRYKGSFCVSILKIYHGFDYPQAFSLLVD